MTAVSTPRTSSDSLLRLAMRADAVLSGLVGVALIAAGGWFSPPPRELRIGDAVAIGFLRP